VVVATGPYAIRAHGPPAGKEDRPPTAGNAWFRSRQSSSDEGQLFAAGPDILEGKTVAPFENVKFVPLACTSSGPERAQERWQPECAGRDPTRRRHRTGKVTDRTERNRKKEQDDNEL